jgi:hypothetical protein
MDKKKLPVGADRSVIAHAGLFLKIKGPDRSGPFIV